MTPHSEAEAPYLTVIIPCFNEASILRATIEDLTRYLDAGAWSPTPRSWELLLVDDGSADGTRDILKESSRRDERVRYISHPVNAGQGRALQTGFASARGDWIFCVDADLDYAPRHIQDFVEVAERTGVEIVIGSAYMPGGSVTGVPYLRLFMSRLMNWYFRKILGLRFHTYTSIVRLYKRATIQDLLMTANDKDLLPEIIIKSTLLGTPMMEVPAHLHWKQLTGEHTRPGAHVITVAKKASRHLLWGAMENPMLFFLMPASICAFGTIWFGVATLILFVRALAQANATGLSATTAAASAVTQNNPQTVVSLVVLLVVSLVLFSLNMVILQNKIKQNNDFLYLSRIFRQGRG